ncbi:hypothetical protein FB451DRAFT_1393872 [Mycena latifolia]|nr:hypothetical protein FB451DRAFT_1393872 [Mycena latifolia]
MFENASHFRIDGGNFMNILGNVTIFPLQLVQRSAVQEQPASPEPVTLAGTGNHALDSQHVPEDAYSDSGSYSSQLLRRGRGFPLYVPEPHRNLPREYRDRGLAIGDVGRVTPEGIFDFFFNIYLPADHPINANRVPENFRPLTPYVAMDVIHHDYAPGDYVSTASVQKLESRLSASGLPTGEFVFDCNSPRGAVLAIPFGSHLEKLENLQSMRHYAATNAESWYEYVNGTRGRGIANGSLYVVTGCEKARSWGMAAFQDRATQGTFQLSFKPTINTITGVDRYQYRWTATGPARTKDSGVLPSADDPLDQTLFIHGLSISLGKGIWKLFKNVQISQIVDTRSRRCNGDFIPYGSQGFSFSWSLGFFGGGGTGGGKECTGLSGDPPDDVTISKLSETPKLFHPSQVINDYLLHKFPDAKVVMSHDDDWRDIFRSDDNRSISEESLAMLRRACDEFFVIQEPGFVTVRSNDLRSLNGFQQPTSSSLPSWSNIASFPPLPERFGAESDSLPSSLLPSSPGSLTGDLPSYRDESYRGQKYRLAGGWWGHGADKGCKRTGAGVPRVRDFMANQNLLGWKKKRFLVRGAAKLVPLPRDQIESVRYKLAAPSAARALNFGLYPVDSAWIQYIIKSHAFHNAHLLRALPPRNLHALNPLLGDQRLKHDELRTSRDTSNQAHYEKAATALKKRNAGDDGGTRPRIRQKNAASSNRCSIVQNETMVATRSRRTITRAAKAIAMSDGSEDEDVPEDGHSDMDEEYLYSGSG